MPRIDVLGIFAAIGLDFKRPMGKILARRPKFGHYMII
jgi:hypothetical protein